MNLSRRIFRRALVGALVTTFILVGACNGSDDVQKGAQPGLVVDPSETVAFDEIDVNDSVSKTIEISNEGGATLKIRNVTLEEGDEDDKREFTAGNNWREKATIPADESVTLTIRYSPRNSNRDTGTVTFDTNDPDYAKKNKPDYTVKLQPRELQPRLGIEDPINFGSARRGTTIRKPILIRNRGEAVLTINRIQLGGSSLFQVTVPKEDDGSGDGDGNGKGDKKMNKDKDMDDQLKPKDDKKVGDVLPVSIDPNETFTLRGWFMPEDNNPESTNMTIYSNDPDGKRTVKLIGNSKSPCLKLSHEDSLAFGSASTGKIARKRITMKNCRPRSEKPLKVRSIKVSDDDGGVFSVNESTLPGKLANGKPFKLPGDKLANFEVNFTPPKNKSYEGKLQIKSNDPALQNHKVNLTGQGTDNECPSAKAKAKVKGSGRLKKNINALPLDTIIFDASNSSDPDGKVARYEWSIISRPAGSNARLTPHDNKGWEKPSLQLDIAGTYRVELIVFDDEGSTSCGKQSIITIKAIPESDIHVQLVWDTPNDQDPTDDSGTDLDLHYLNPKGSSWNEAPWDIFWNNASADWGSENNTNDDPKLKIDVTSGQGPENINHPNPVSGKQYRVGVYYYDDHGFGPSYATVRIYTRGTLARQYKNKFMSGTFDFWKVGLIEWPSGNIFPRDEKFKGFPNTP